MEVDILISSSLDKISSPWNLTTAIGVPPRAKLRLFRDPKREGQSRLLVCCDKPTASRLRHRFRVSRVYTHDGQLLSLTFVGMRPMADRNPESLTKCLCDVATATSPQEEVGAPAAGGGGGGENASRARILPPPSTSSRAAAGVEFALEWVEQADANSLHAPGIADLYEEFTGNRKRFENGEEKSREFIMENKQCTTIYQRPRHRWWSGEEKGEEGEEEEKGGEEKQRRLM